ncbi:putative Serine-threonine protein kinase, plant-type [Hibiscus syriacus]|uniref:Serine-threonine protein kinase, plant-type n=1 Tax=Hibiscus syriacus TaxID=106335 RepID=A0A6A3AQ47_HIBSY|nr:putative Serine-threonine protein kinase, plant-type [Hibiscus syriacus]
MKTREGANRIPRLSSHRALDEQMFPGFAWIIAEYAFAVRDKSHSMESISCRKFIKWIIQALFHDFKSLIPSPPSDFRRHTFCQLTLAPDADLSAPFQKNLQLLSPAPGMIFGFQEHACIMNTLVQFGAPKSILVDGKPHLGTDRLVPLLRNFRQHLQSLGVEINFGMRVDDLLIQDGHVVGVEVSDSTTKLQSDCKKLGFDAVILAVGHSARDIYQMLLSHNVDLVPKDFAVGLRVEHPQELINNIQYSALANEICRGRGKVPVADYKVVHYVNDKDENSPLKSESISRSCYSFCMCPGGQVVLTSTSPSEICINGMSFSHRASKWANAALVVTVSMKDFDALNFHGPLAGIEFQREFERRAAIMGGGNFTVPVQTVTDFMENKISVTSMPPSSYRLGVKAAGLHELFPSYMTDALRYSISMFDKELPGFISKEALLHGVETRTSSPIQILRDVDTYESLSLRGLYPAGEGAGYAGGIVSAAVDGMYTGFSVAKRFDLFHGNVDSVLGKAQSAGVRERKRKREALWSFNRSPESEEASSCRPPLVGDHRRTPVTEQREMVRPEVFPRSDHGSKVGFAWKGLKGRRSTRNSSYSSTPATPSARDVRPREIFGGLMAQRRRFRDGSSAGECGSEAAAAAG